MSPIGRALKRLTDVVVSGTALLFGWPIFLIVWFGRGRIRAEVRDWSAGKDQAAG